MEKMQNSAFCRKKETAKKLSVDQSAVRFIHIADQDQPNRFDKKIRLVSISETGGILKSQYLVKPITYRQLHSYQKMFTIQKAFDLDSDGCSGQSENRSQKYEPSKHHTRKSSF